MELSPLTKIKLRTAHEICAIIKNFDAKAILVADPVISTEDLLIKLFDTQQYQSMTQFLAHALLKREAVWWACVCSHQIVDKDTPLINRHVLEATKQWIKQPTEDNRRAAHNLVEQAGYEHPASWAALAAYWSEGSIAPPEAPLVAAADELTGHAVASAVLLAAVFKKPQHAEKNYQRYLKQGLHIAAGGDGNIL